VSVRRRLALYGVGVAAAGMFAFIFLLWGLGSNSARENQDRILGEIAEAAATALARTDGTGADRPFIVADLRTTTEPFVIVLAADGRARYASGLIDGQPPHIPAAVVVEANERGRSVATISIPPPAADPSPTGATTARPTLGLRLVARKWQSASASGVVVAGQSTAFPDDQIAGFRLLLIVSAIVTLIAVAIVSWLVAGRAVKPLVSLAATTDEIGTTGDLSRRLALSRDRDEVGRLTTSFNAMLDRLQRAQAELAAALAAQQRFVADASHELRTPLATIRTNAEFLREHPDAKGDDRTSAIDDVVAEAERMSRLVDGLLILARADAGVAMERRPVDLRAVATEEARRHGSGLRDAARDVAVQADGAALVSGDPDALGRVVRILLDNAFRHGSAPVRVSVSRADGRVRLEVRDSGRGLPAGTEERVFDRFYQADPARSGEGSGLGLSIARAVVEAHGGTISAANASGGGSVFRVDLPAL
jgi:signal transduction histidine kinase